MATLAASTAHSHLGEEGGGAVPSGWRGPLATLLQAEPQRERRIEARRAAGEEASRLTHLPVRTTQPLQERAGLALGLGGEPVGRSEVEDLDGPPMGLPEEQIPRVRRLQQLKRAQSERAATRDQKRVEELEEPQAGRNLLPRALAHTRSPAEGVRVLEGGRSGSPPCLPVERERAGGCPREQLREGAARHVERAPVALARHRAAPQAPVPHPARKLGHGSPLAGSIHSSPLYTVVGPVNLQSAVRAPMRRERGELEGRVHLVEGYERRAWVVPQVAAAPRIVEPNPALPVVGVLLDGGVPEDCALVRHGEGRAVEGRPGHARQLELREPAIGILLLERD
mmetsp:Transcript_49867/g.161067  ORF Transcript_49867/g.161067 Transcript_49867/m.161067 type:complete len:340 (-) Transcript_49867:110-1129(-)